MYIGRFAPTPSGPLHFGSLIAAVASYLQAQTQQGKWLIRIENTDIQRNKKNADKHILKTLADFGFKWYEPVSYQTQRSDYYEQALLHLHNHNHTYYCDCSRKDITHHGKQGEFGIIYAGTCSNKNLSRHSNCAIRLRTPDQYIHFTDQIFGDYQQNIAQQIGDFHLMRRDQCYAYHLAAVVDDHQQGVTEIVRGYDILDSTPRQIYLQQCLNYQTPKYLHIPLAVDAKGIKLSKHTFAQAISSKESAYFLYNALMFLGQNPETKLKTATNKEIWEWAVNHWQIQQIPKQHHIHFDL